MMVPTDTTPEELLQQGIDLSQRGDYAAAISLFNQTLELRSDCLEAWSEKGSALINLGQLEPALRCFERSLLVHPTSPYLHYHHAWTAHLAGLYDNAANGFKRCLELQPNYANAHYGVGLALYMLARYEDAIPPLKKAAELAPTSRDCFYVQGPPNDRTLRRSRHPTQLRP
jgi:tetratricopeptide (TPR) repeat protein